MTYHGNSLKKDQTVLDVIPAFAGPRLVTHSGGAVHSFREPGSQMFVSKDHFASVMLAPSAGMSAAFASDNLYPFDAPAGMLVISPATVESKLIWSSKRENVSIALSPSGLSQLAEHEFDGQALLQPIPFGVVDHQALQFARMLKAELNNRETANELYVDSLTTIFWIHLLRRYVNRKSAQVRVSSGLSAKRAKRVEEYLRENYFRKLTVADLAAVCELSPSYFTEAFTRRFGQPPHQYLLDLRLAAAERLLVQSDRSIAQVAYQAGFSSQSHLTTAMRKHKNLTPAQLRRAK